MRVNEEFVVIMSRYGMVRYQYWYHTVHSIIINNEEGGDERKIMDTIFMHVYITGIRRYEDTYYLLSLLQYDTVPVL